MRVTPPVTITASKVVATNVVEVAPAVWTAPANFGPGDKTAVAIANNGFDVYESLAPANAGNNPPASPLWWKRIGTTYGAYDGPTAYAKGAIVIDPANHLEYESAVDANTNQPLTDSTKWVLRGSTNPYRMFDLRRRSGTSRPGSVEVRVAPGQRCDTIGLVGLIGDELTIEVYDGPTLRYTHTQKLRYRNTRSWSDYFFGRFKQLSKVARFNLPPYSTGQIVIRVTKATGEAAIGSVVVGKSVYLGRTLLDPESDALNFSKIERNFAGELSTLTPKRSVPTIDVRIHVNEEDVEIVKQVRDDELNAVVALWSGIDDVEHGYFGVLLTIGIYRKMTLRRLDSGPAILTLQTEEV